MANVSFVERSYLDGRDLEHLPLTRIELASSSSKSRIERGARAIRHNATRTTVALAAGLPFDDSELLEARSMPAISQGWLVELDARDLLRFSRCGFGDLPTSRFFQGSVIGPALGGQYSYCSAERNPFIPGLLAEAKARKLPEEELLLTRRNCTGNPANAFNKPKVDLGAAALAFRPAHECAAQTKITDGSEATLAEALSLVGLSLGGLRLQGRRVPLITDVP